MIDCAVSSDNPDSFPRLSQAAYYGLFGEMLKAVEPETEADPAAVLLGWLTCFGNVVGRGAWAMADVPHHPSLYVATVGPTSAAKGVAWGVISAPFQATEPDWYSRCPCYGVSTGQGLIDRVRDEHRTMTLNKKTGLAEEKVLPGALDKRCLLRLDELAVAFKMQASDKSTLGETLLTGWGGATLETPNTSQGENYRRATGYGIGVYGDTQPGTLRKILEGGRVEAVNGWLNRFLWAAVETRPDVEDPKPPLSVLSPFLDRLRESLSSAKQAGELRRDNEAGKLWKSVYGGLRRSGDTVPHTDRARPQVVRLSLIFALLDKSPAISRQHLEAALAVWDYCRESARLIFGGGGDGPTGEPEPLWLEVLNYISANPGIPQGDITKKFQRKADAGKLSEVLGGLEAKGLAHYRDEATGGRKVRRWLPGSRSDDTNIQTQSHSSAGEAVKEVSKFVTGSPKLTYLFPAGGEDAAGEDTSFLQRPEPSALCDDAVSSEKPTAERGLLR